MLVSGPLFSAMHGINNLHHSRIWGRVVLDDVFRRFGIRGAILVHMLNNLLDTFQGSEAFVLGYLIVGGTKFLLGSASCIRKEWGLSR